MKFNNFLTDIYFGHLNKDIFHGFKDSKDDDRTRNFIEQYLEIRNEAQRIHDKAYEMRSKIIALKGERRKRRDEAKKAIQEQNIRARKAVMDKDKLEEIADKSVDALRKGKKITLKR